MKVEPVREEDIPACREIYNYYVENSFSTLEEEPLSLKAYEARVRGVEDASYPFFVAREAGHIFGFAYLSAFNPRSGYRRTADLSIYVEKDAVRRHIGAVLYAAAEEAARAMGLSNIISIITSANVPSCRFHEKNGFVCEGVLHGVAEKFGRIFDVSFYRKAL